MNNESQKKLKILIDTISEKYLWKGCYSCWSHNVDYSSKWNQYECFNCKTLFWQTEPSIEMKKPVYLWDIISWLKSKETISQSVILTCISLYIDLKSPLEDQQEELITYLFQFI